MRWSGSGLRWVIVMNKAESHEPVAWIVPVQTHGGDISQKLSWTKSGAGISGVLFEPSERFPLYKSPHKPWVGLTADEIWSVYKQVDSMQYVEFAHAIEAKLKEMNNG